MDRSEYLEPLNVETQGEDNTSGKTAPTSRPVQRKNCTLSLPRPNSVLPCPIAPILGRPVTPIRCAQDPAATPNRCGLPNDARHAMQRKRTKSRQVEPASDKRAPSKEGSYLGITSCLGMLLGSAIPPTAPIATHPGATSAKPVSTRLGAWPHRGSYLARSSHRTVVGRPKQPPDLRNPHCRTAKAQRDDLHNPSWRSSHRMRVFYLFLCCYGSLWGS